jgi:transcriptional regulator with XRE-family HTH domain
MAPAEEFRAARTALGLTQAALAAVLRVSLSHVSHVEQGAEKPSEALCELLRMKVAVKITFCEFLEQRLGTRRWCVKQRLTDRLRHQGYEVAVSQKKFTALRAEFEAITE